MGLQKKKLKDGAAMSELNEFKKVVSPIAYGLAYKSELGTTEYQQLYAEGDVVKYFNNKPQLTIPKSIADELDKVPFHNPIAQLSNKDCDLTDFNDTVKRYAWNNQETGYICVAYLAGKALGVDLVKVVEGMKID